MNITIEYKKQKALELMKTLDIYKPYIKGFEKDNNVCFFEGFGGFWAYQEPELMAKIKEFEENTWNSANVTTFYSFPIMKKNGMKCCIDKAERSMLTPMSGTKPTTTARSLAR